MKEITGMRSRAKEWILRNRKRLEEIAQIHEHKAYTKVPIEQCWKETRKAPVRVRCLDINKGDEVNRDYRF